jgi:predicted DNA-binding transcriptional regulator AlpA
MSGSSNVIDDKLIDREAAARVLSVSPRTLDRWHILSQGPARIVIGSRMVRYRASTLRAWIRLQELRMRARKRDRQSVPVK